MSDELSDLEINRMMAGSTDDYIQEGRRRLAEGNALRKAEAEKQAKAKAAEVTAKAAALKQAADAEALRLRAEIRRAYTGSNAEFEKAFPALLAIYKERETWRNLEQWRENAKEQLRRIA